MLKGGSELSLTKTEFRLLCEFADHAGAVLSRDQLLERVWGYEYLGDSRLVDAHVRRLRVKIEDHPDEPRLIVTVRGLGYRPACAYPVLQSGRSGRRAGGRGHGARRLRRYSPRPLAWGSNAVRAGDALAELADDHEVERPQVGQLVAADLEAGGLGQQRGGRASGVRLARSQA